jgi:hypothetical protein
MDRTIAFGPGLVQAYELEQEAVYPRIVLTRVLAGLAKLQPVSFLHSGITDGVNRDFVRGEDDRTFVNYLAVLPYISDDKNGTLTAHKTHIEEALKEFASDGHIWDKYRWLADYHDFIIRRDHYNLSQLRIASDLLRSGFELHSLYSFPATKPSEPLSA